VLPPFLYRGDSDPDKKRRLRSSEETGYLITNLGDGGDGREIFNHRFEELVVRHCTGQWRISHLLSLSKAPDTAKKFARGCECRPIVRLADDSETWATAVLTFDLAHLSRHMEISPGVFYCEYNTKPRFDIRHPLSIAHAVAEERRILIVDVVRHLRHVGTATKDSQRALANALRDLEWVILPINAVALEVGVEFTCRIETTIISQWEKFAWA